MKKKVWIVCGVWTLFALWNFLSPKRVFSEAENRYLKQKPKLEGQTIANGSYMEEYETWMSDQLVFRDGFVSLKASADQALGRSESGGVYLGKDGYLLEMFWSFDEERLQRNTEAAAGFLRRMEEQGCEVHFLMAPTAACVMEEKLPDFAPELSQEELFVRLQGEIPGFVNPVPAFHKARQELEETKENQLYYRTDHHWTSLGAYYAYTALCEARGEKAPERDSYESEVLSTEFYGTNYSRAGLYSVRPDMMHAMYRDGAKEICVDYGNGEQEGTLYDRSMLFKRDKYRVFLKGNYPLTRISTGQKNGKRLLLVKDSYANTFVQFLMEDYEEILMVDPRYFRQNLETFAKEEKVTDVLLLYQVKKFAEDTAFATLCSS